MIERGMPAQHLWRAGRQMKLAAADIHPHVAVGDHQIGVAGEAEAGHVEQGRQPLVGDLDVDMLEMDGIAEVFGGAVEMLLLHDTGSRMCGPPIIMKGGAGDQLPPIRAGAHVLHCPRQPLP